MERRSIIIPGLICFVSAFFIVACLIRLSSEPKKRMVPLTELVFTPNILQDVGSLALGARRMGANLVYIQLLQYYGVGLYQHSQDDDEAHEHKDHHGHNHSVPPNFDSQFKRLKEFGLRILRINPSFNAVILEVAGGLAFNERRIDEALELLKEAINRDPTYFRYHLYIAAILYKEQGDDELLIQKLDEAITYPDCPSMLKNVLANLYKKKGRFDRAAQIYLHILEKSVYEGDRSHARSELEELLNKYPSLHGHFRLP